MVGHANESITDLHSFRPALTHIKYRPEWNPKGKQALKAITERHKGREVLSPTRSTFPARVQTRSNAPYSRNAMTTSPGKRCRTCCMLRDVSGPRSYFLLQPCTSSVNRCFVSEPKPPANANPQSLQSAQRRKKTKSTDDPRQNENRPPPHAKGRARECASAKQEMQRSR